MKTFLLALTIAVSMIFGSIFFTSRIDDASREMSEYIKEIKVLIAEEDYENAISHIEELKYYIDEKRPELTATMDHANINKIYENFAEMYVYAMEEQKYDALSKCEVLIVLFEYMPKNYNVKLENIL